MALTGVINPNIKPGVGFKVNTNAGSGPYAEGPSVTELSTVSGFAAPSGTVSSGVSLTVGTTHLTNLTWNGINLTETIDLAPTVINVHSLNGSTDTNLTTTPTSTTSVGNTITQTFPWGSIAYTYTASGNDLLLAITITNTQSAGNNLYRWWIFPLVMNFPSTPASPNQSAIAFDYDAIAMSYVDFTTGVCCFSRENVSTGVTDTVGFGPYPVDYNNHPTRWFAMFFVDPTQQGPNNNWPIITNTINAGTSKTFNFAVHFGRPNELIQNLCAHVIAAYQTAFPQTTTPSPYPIGMQFLGGLVRPSPIQNPRCWNNGDPTLIITNADGTPSTTGTATFHTFAQNFITGAIAELTRVKNLIGVAPAAVFWDFEGYGSDQTYIGSPNLIETMAPEWLAASGPNFLDGLMTQVKNAGFEIGFTLRPQNTTVIQGKLSNVGTSVTWVSGSQFDPTWVGQRIFFGVNTYNIIAATNTTITLAASPVPPTNLTNVAYLVAQQPNTNHLTVLNSKVSYCISRWGAKHFYVDTTTLAPGTLTPVAVFKQLSMTYPNVFFYPENVNPLIYGAGGNSYPWTDTKPSPSQFWPQLGQSNMIYPICPARLRINAYPAINSDITDLTNVYVYGGANFWFQGWFHDQATDVMCNIINSNSRFNGGGGGGVTIPSASMEMYIRNFIADEGEVAGESNRVLQMDTFIATGGQTIFVLSQTPDATYSPIVYVNQQLQFFYTIASRILTFTTGLHNGDVLKVIYWT